MEVILFGWFRELRKMFQKNTYTCECVDGLWDECKNNCHLVFMSWHYVPQRKNLIGHPCKRTVPCPQMGLQPVGGHTSNTAAGTQRITWPLHPSNSSVVCLRWIQSFSTFVSFHNDWHSEASDRKDGARVDLASSQIDQRIILYSFFDQYAVFTAHY